MRKEAHKNSGGREKRRGRIMKKKERREKVVDREELRRGSVRGGR